MIFALACYGTRGDVEPGVAVADELRRRGHEVRMAVPPDLVSFVETAGLPAVAYGLDERAILEAQRNFSACLSHEPWKVKKLVTLWREILQLTSLSGREVTTTLKSLANGADLLITGMMFDHSAANIAEYYSIPLATMHFFPMRPNGQVVPYLPARLVRSALTASEWIGWRIAKKADDIQRSELGLPESTGPLSQWISEHRCLEIQAYDDIFFPGLAAEWSQQSDQRPFIGTPTIELSTDVDDEVLSWISAGPPPIFFGFGSISVKSPSNTLAMISAACEHVGERALLCAGWSKFSDVPHSQHVKVVEAVNYAAIFPACRAVVHHGGIGTTAAGLRAGRPTVILSGWLDQMVWVPHLKRLKVGFGRRFSSIGQKTLIKDLQRIRAPLYASRAQELAARITKPADSASAAADLIENCARSRSDG
ncbi:glycosyl transferase family 1 [Mycolicibacterium acapulense]|nr:glycosyl transferase family 1 [Mycolicibacterium acapulense]